MNESQQTTQATKVSPGLSGRVVTASREKDNTPRVPRD